jgi:hypothetical protein
MNSCRHDGSERPSTIWCNNKKQEEVSQLFQLVSTLLPYELTLQREIKKKK